METLDKITESDLSRGASCANNHHLDQALNSIQSDDGDMTNGFTDTTGSNVTQRLVRIERDVSQIRVDIARKSGLDYKLLFGTIALLIPVLSGGLFVINSIAKDLVVPIAQKQELSALGLQHLQDGHEKHRNLDFHKGAEALVSGQVTRLEQRLLREMDIREKSIRLEMQVIKNTKGIIKPH